MNERTGAERGFWIIYLANARSKNPNEHNRQLMNFSASIFGFRGLASCNRARCGTSRPI